MRQVTVSVFADHGVATVSNRMFGSFVEHMGRCVYGGIYEPGSEFSDELGFRTDVMARCRELGLTLVRYPGGNFVSGYHWEDGTGPREHRPRRRELAWRATETNQFGISDFAEWCSRVGVEPMVAVNLGTRSFDAATSLLEYCNHPSGSYWADRRVSDGSVSPFGFKLWCLGNEMDGPWQLGNRSAGEYGSTASMVARAMKQLDDSIELVVAGSSKRQMPTFPAWDREVLELTYDHIDYLSVHQYYGAEPSDPGSYLRSNVDFDSFLDEAIATCDYVRAVRRSPKVVDLSVDEWNVTHPAESDPPREPWAVAPPIAEFAYDSLDAVVEASLMMSLLRHADRVPIACQSLLVNVGGLIRAEPGKPAYRSSIFIPLARMARVAGGTVHPVEVRDPRSPTHPERGQDIDALCVRDRNGSDLHVFVLNRNAVEPVQVSVAWPGGRFDGRGTHEYIDPDLLGSANAARQVAHNLELSVKALSWEQGAVTLELSPGSWHALALKGA
jgi:alpha-L-arabinofuranosidase